MHIEQLLCKDLPLSRLQGKRRVMSGHVLHGQLSAEKITANTYVIKLWGREPCPEESEEEDVERVSDAVLRYPYDLIL